MHHGNHVLHGLIEDKLDDYANTDIKNKKSAIVTDIITAVRRSSPKGGFVRYVNGHWMELGDDFAREKVGQM